MQPPPQGQPPYQSGPNYPQQPQYSPQGPQQPYVPQQQYQQPPMQQMPPVVSQPPKKSFQMGCAGIAGMMLVGVFIGIFVGYVIRGGSEQPVTSTTTSLVQATTAPTKPTTPPTPKTWTVIQTFTGNGTKKTDTFTIGDTWKLQWSCDPTQNAIGQYNVIVAVTGSDGTPIDPAAINTVCKPGNTSGETIERQSGSVFLDVTSEDAWTVKILALK